MAPTKVLPTSKIQHTFSHLTMHSKRGDKDRNFEISRRRKQWLQNGLLRWQAWRHNTFKKLIRNYTAYNFLSEACADFFIDQSFEKKSVAGGNIAAFISGWKQKFKILNFWRNHHFLQRESLVPLIFCVASKNAPNYTISNYFTLKTLNSLHT